MRTRDKQSGRRRPSFVGSGFKLGLLSMKCTSVASPTCVSNGKQHLNRIQVSVKSTTAGGNGTVGAPESRSPVQLVAARTELIAEA